ncbi:MAG: SLBB domain-containing protein, partial [Woeseia sp.]
QVSITLGELRAVQVFLVGDVKKPGSYSVGALSTMTTVLSTGGGIARQGSLRRIELKRAGKTVGELDVYDLLLNGDTRQDLCIQEGDVIFVPPVGKRVKIVGEVNRPAIYEMHESASVQDVIRMAGGMTAEAVATDITIERVVPDKGLVTIEPDLDRTGGNVTAALDGDLIRIPTAIRVIDKAVTVAGNVHYPVYAEWRSGLRLSDVIPSARILRPNSDINYVLIQREPVPNVGMDALSADLESAWRSPGSVADPLLEPRDRIFVFDLQVGRAHIMGPILEEMQLRTSRDRKMRVVTVDGSVNAPGDVPLEPGMRIADLIRAGGGLAQSAYIEEAELTRYELNDAGEREARLISVDLAAALAGETAANLLLQPFDFMNIRETPNWTRQSFIELKGEVRFPGRYAVNNGESISDILERAGGLTSRAFPSGSVFTRESLKKRERDQILKLASRIELDLASLSLSDSGHSNAIGVGQSLLGQLRSTEPTGRLVIDLPSVTGRDRSADILVEDGDLLLVPRQPQEVTVIGEVQFSTSHVWQPGYNRGDYLARSGGTTNKADDKRIYIVRANGEVISGKESRFFASRDRTQILAGDTIVVPLDTDRVRPLTLWTSVSQIVYNLAIAATAVSRF